MLKSIGFSIALLTLLFSHVVLAQDATPAAPKPPTTDKNIVYDMDGEAKIRRSSWDSAATSQPLSVADEVGNNDVVVPVDGTIVTILCADGKLVQVAEMMGPPPCKPMPGGSGDDDGLIDAALINRGSADTALLITPNGKMLSNKPSFRWMTVKNASQYKVVISQNGALVWKKEYIVPAASPKMDYPKDEEPLAPGDYAIKIDALNGAGRALSFDTPVTQITIVPDEVSKAVLDSVKTPNLKSIKEGMVAYRTARVYASNEFYADAIKMLEDALKVNVPDGVGLTHKNDKPNSLRTGALPYILLGNWYNKIHLSDYAGQAYQSALTVAEQFDQPENAAWASVQLAVVLTDLRMKYCGFANASSFFSSVFDQGSLIDQVQQQMADTVSALGYEPTCATS